MLYSDREFQNTPPQFKSLFGAEITQNMSRAGMCIDNGQWNRSGGGPTFHLMRAKI